MLVTDDLDDTTIECAGALMAREHAAARQVRPELPAGFIATDLAAALFGLSSWPCTLPIA